MPHRNNAGCTHFPIKEKPKMGTTKLLTAALTAIAVMTVTTVTAAPVTLRHVGAQSSRATDQHFPLFARF